MCGNLSFKFKGQTCLNQRTFIIIPNAEYPSQSQSRIRKSSFSIRPHIFLWLGYALASNLHQPYILHRYITTNHATGYGLESWAPWIGWRIAGIV